MPEPAPGLRARKKQQTFDTLSETAIALFLERGFDQVPVAEVAAAAGVSKPTLFRYFPAKEDLVLHRFADHEDEAARVVTGRAADETPLEALRRDFLAGLERQDPVTGLCDHPDVLAFQRLAYGTPSVVARMLGFLTRSEEALAAALGGGTAARLAAGQIIAVRRILAEENRRRIEAGEKVADVLPDARDAAGLAFGQLGSGVGALGA
ncbi:TetR family transcriptional regulator [Streptomyces indicus]|uniref:DNA-binding transcriptional regulator, AcrR family n=1 Tax=Streptomyces indicus TaxID=417292 RepID=A0A1G9H8Z2_9ACTN|nr:TetR family transcriptional regulator [Streptomyces indicus]SDL09478.1 DNA-binding transcriptional regulator, AcrR family [Streptomyces indicus]